MMNLLLFSLFSFSQTVLDWHLEPAQIVHEKSDSLYSCKLGTQKIGYYKDTQTIIIDDQESLLLFKKQNPESQHLTLQGKSHDFLISLNPNAQSSNEELIQFGRLVLESNKNAVYRLAFSMFGQDDSEFVWGQVQQNYREREDLTHATPEEFAQDVLRNLHRPNLESHLRAKSALFIPLQFSESKLSLRFIDELNGLQETLTMDCKKAL